MIKKIKRREVYATFKDNILAWDLADMRSLSSFNRGVKYLQCVIDVFTDNTWVGPLTDKKSKAVLDGFIGMINESKCKPIMGWSRKKVFK